MSTRVEARSTGTPAASRSIETGAASPASVASPSSFGRLARNDSQPATTATSNSTARPPKPQPMMRTSSGRFRFPRKENGSAPSLLPIGFMPGVAAPG